MRIRLRIEIFNRTFLKQITIYLLKAIMKNLKADKKTAETIHELFFVKQISAAATNIKNRKCLKNAIENL